MISKRAVVLSRSSPRLTTTASLFDGRQPFIPTGPSHSTKFEQVIKTTQTLDGNIVPRLLAPADEVIERPPCLFMVPDNNKFYSGVMLRSFDMLCTTASAGTVPGILRGVRSAERGSKNVLTYDCSIDICC